jgi:hypothetical protein
MNIVSVRKIEERHSQYDYNTWLTIDNLMKTIAIRNYYSPIQWANERAGLELSSRIMARGLAHDIRG